MSVSLRLLERQLPVGREAGDADTYEPQRPGPVAEATVEQAACDVSDDRSFVDCRWQGRRARADREVAVPELRRHRATREPRAPEALRDELRRRRTSSCRRSRSVRVARERVLGGDRDGLELKTRGRAGRFPRAVAEERTERARQEGRSSGSASAARAPIVSTPAPQARLGARPDAREQAHRERGEEPRFPAGRDDGDTARLSPVGGDLADDLRRADAERAGEAGTPADCRLDRGRDRAGAREVRSRPSRGRGSPRRSRCARRAGRSRRPCPIPRASTGGRARAAGGRRRRGAAAKRLGRAHRRVDSELPRRVVRGRHDTAPVRVAADDERLRRGARDSRAPRPRRRMRRGRGGRGSSRARPGLRCQARCHRDPNRRLMLARARHRRRSRRPRSSSLRRTRCRTGSSRAARLAERRGSSSPRTVGGSSAKPLTAVASRSRSSLPLGDAPSA